MVKNADGVSKLTMMSRDINGSSSAWILNKSKMFLTCLSLILIAKHYHLRTT